MTSWYKELVIACEKTGENVDELEITLNEHELNREFNNGYAI